MSGVRVIRDHRDAAAAAVESSERRAFAGGWSRCTVTDDEGRQCMYGDTHGVPCHPVVNCSSCGTFAARDGSTLCTRCAS